MIDFLRVGWSRVRSLLRLGRIDEDFQRELATHVDFMTEENIRRGMSPQEARRAARLRLGGTTQLRETNRDLHGFPMLESVWQDVRYAARLLRLNKGFAAVAIISLALGIGANTAIFQLIDAVRMRTLPVKNPEELAVIRPTEDQRAGIVRGFLSLETNAMWKEIRARQQGFSGVFAFGRDELNLTSGGQVRYAQGIWVSGEFFDVLGIQPILGRVFHAADDHAGCGAPGAVLSYRFWQREFGGNANVVGQTVALEGHPFPVLGVTPAGFYGVSVGQRFDVAVLICSEPVIDAERPLYSIPHAWWLAVMGRLKPAWTLERASAQLESISAGIMDETLPPAYPADMRKNFLSQKLNAYPGATGLSQLRQQYESPLWLLLAIAGLVLVIACANLANLMLARASAREMEIAVRMALGAARTRVARQLLIESLLIAIAGAATGTALARGLSVLLVRYLGGEVGAQRLFVDLATDWRVLGFTTALAVLTCVLFGLAPALKATSAASARIISFAGRGLTATHERFSLRRALVVTQVAFSVVLVVSALLFSGSLRKILTLDAGFQRDGLVVVDIDFSRLNLLPERRPPFRELMLERVRSLPGVTAAADTSVVPVSGYGWNDRVVVGGKQSDTIVDMTNISPEYFRTMETPLLKGRDFDERDNSQSPKVAIVNEQFAKKLFAGDALGKTFQIFRYEGEKRYDFQIVGIVRNMKYRDLREEFNATAFYPEAQDAKPDASMEMMVRSDLELVQVVNEVKTAVAQVDSGVALDFHGYDRQIKDGLLRERLLATLSSFFGLLAIVLAAIGIYGVIAYIVARRTNEIGIRMALGATPGEVLGMILRDAGVLFAMGAVAGTLLAGFGAEAAKALLFGLKPWDARVLMSAAAALGAVAFVASYWPAHRAARLQPMTALREE